MPPPHPQVHALDLYEEWKSADDSVSLAGFIVSGLINFLRIHVCKFLKFESKKYVAYLVLRPSATD